MRVTVTAMLVLASVLSPAILPPGNQIASAEERSGGPGMIGPQISPEMMRGFHEMMRGMGMAPPGFHGPRDHERPLISLMLTWKDQLGLSADQERTLRELRVNFEKESIKRSAEIEVAELELDGLLEQDKVDLAKVEALAKKTAMLQAELRVARIKTLEAGKAVLTPEQATKFERLGHESMMQGMGMGMMGSGMPMPPPMYPGPR